MKINSVPKWASAEEANRSRSITDYILKCFREGLDRNETYWACASYVLLKNKAQRQELADLIAKLDTMSVYAKGSIPKEVA